MSFRLEINTGNAAFDDEDLAPEVARILSELATKLDDGMYSMNADVPLYDVNGNRVGSWRLTNA